MVAMHFSPVFMRCCSRFQHLAQTVRRSFRDCPIRPLSHPSAWLHSCHIRVRPGADVSSLRSAVGQLTPGSVIFQLVFFNFSKPEYRGYGFIHGEQSLWKIKTFFRVFIRHTTLSVVVDDEERISLHYGGRLVLFFWVSMIALSRGIIHRASLREFPMFFPLIVRSNR